MRSISDLVDVIEPVDGADATELERIGFIADLVLSHRAVAPIYSALLTPATLDTPVGNLSRVDSYLAHRLTNTVACALKDLDYSSD